jgi:hypothetical protein
LEEELTIGIGTQIKLEGYLIIIYKNMDKVIINTFNKGMASDQHPSLQDSDTYRYALNAIHEGVNESRSGLQNELSNELFSEIPGEIVGYRFIEERDKFLFFHIDGVNTLSWIDIKTKEITKIATDSEFGCDWGFDKCEWIYAEDKVMQPCNELNVYWSSNSTYYKANIDILLNPKRRSCLKCEDFELFHSICTPNIRANVVDGGGFDLVSGAYQFVAQLEDHDGKTSNWFYTSEPSYITSPNNVAGEPSTKSIKIDIRELDSRYNKVNVAVIRTIGGVVSSDIIAKRYYTSTGISINYYGTTGEEQPVSLSEILTKTRKYFKGNDLVQKDGKLFIYNLLSENNLNYQRRANDIQTEWVAYRISQEDANKHKSMMRDEVYAPAIVWNYSDGTSSFGFHIPGRATEVGTAATCTNCNTVAIQENTANSITGNGPTYVQDSNSSFTSVAASGEATPLEMETYPASQDYDYDRFKQEVDQHDPTTPSVNQTGDGNNAATKALDDMSARISTVDTTSTGACEECAQAQTEAANDLADDAGSGAGDFITNLDNSSTDSNSSTSIKDSGAELLNRSKLKEEVRVSDTYKYYRNNEDFQNPSISGSAGTYNPIQPSTGSNASYLSRSKSLFNGSRCQNIRPAEVDSGQTGTYISTELYPMSKDCDGEFIYGDLAGLPIRHHRMPDNKMSPHFYSTQHGVPNKYDINNIETHNTDVIIIGMRFTNIQFPIDSELPKPLCPNSPYKIVYVKRDDVNKSIVAKGIFTHVFEGESHGRKYAFPKHAVNSREYVDRSIVIDSEDSNKIGLNSTKAAYTFHSPDTTYDTPPLAIDAVKPELEYFGSGWRHGLYASGEKPYNIYEEQVDQKGARQAVNLNHYANPSSSDLKCITGVTYAPGNKVVLNPEGIDLPLMNLWRESSVYLQMEGSPMDLARGIDGGLSDTSFLGDGLDHECPIPYAGAMYGSLKRAIPNQYGSVVNQRYVDLGLNANSSQGNSIEGVCGDIWIGMHQFRRTSYVSNKIGEDIETDKTPEPEYTGLMKYLMIGDCTELPKVGDTNDAKNYANLRPDENCHVTLGDPGPPTTDIYYPKVVKTIVSFWVESDVNTWNKATGEALLGEVSYPKLKELELDSRANSIDWTKAYLNRFYAEVRRPSKWKMAVASLIRTLVNFIPASMMATDVFDIDSTLDAGLTGLEALMTAGIWVSLNFLLFTPKNVRRILGLPECEPDRRGGNLNEEVFQWEDNYKKYNYDYSIVNDKNIHIGLPDSYNTCICKDSSCNTKFTTNEIYYSNKQILDSQYDAYQNFEANDYLAMPAESGSITKLFTESSKFYAHTTDGIYLLQYNNSSIPLGERVALLGGGNLLTNPIKYMENVPEGFLGLKDPNACIATGYGYFFIDREASIIYKFQGGQATPISYAGLSIFFKDNLKFCSEGTCCDDEKSYDGSFYSMGVDYRYNRLLITKNDKVDCASFTVSLDLMTNQWISYHSYKPKLYLYDRSRLWTIDNNDGNMWLHNVKSEGYQTFYGDYFPFIVEFSARTQDMSAAMYQSTMLDTQAEILGTIELLDRNVTFNKASIRTTVQSSGVLDIIPITQENEGDEDIASKIRDLWSSIRLVRQHKEWRFNEVFNVADHNIPLTLPECEECDNGLSVINESNSNFSEVEIQQFVNRKLLDRYFVYRYEFNSIGNKQVRLLLRSNKTLVDYIIR